MEIYGEISMEFHGNWCPNPPWNSMENFPWKSMEFYGGFSHGQSRSRTPLCTRNQFLFCKKDAFQNVILSEKKIDTAFLYRFSKCQPTREPVSFACLAREKLNILTSQQCLHPGLSWLIWECLLSIPGGYSHTLPIRVCAAQRDRDFEASDLERGIHFRGIF